VWLARQRLVRDVRIVWTRTTYLLLWQEDHGIMAASLDRHRRVVNPRRLVLQGAFLSSDVAWNGDRALVTSHRGQTERNRAALLYRDGTVDLPDIALPEEIVYEPRIASDGDSFYLFARNPVVVGEPPGPPTVREELVVARISAAGVPTSLAANVLFIRDVLSQGYGVAFDSRRLAVAAIGGDSHLHRVFVDPPACDADPIGLMGPMGPVGA
jgi:hypothetical protein